MERWRKQNTLSLTVEQYIWARIECIRANYLVINTRRRKMTWYSSINYHLNCHSQ